MSIKSFSIFYTGQVSILKVFQSLVEILLLLAMLAVFPIDVIDWERQR